MSLASNSNVVDYKYPTYLVSLVDQWGSGYQILIQGYGGPADETRMRDMLAGLDAQGRVDWGNCTRFDRGEEVATVFDQNTNFAAPGRPATKPGAETPKPS